MSKSPLRAASEGGDQLIPLDRRAKVLMLVVTVPILAMMYGFIWYRGPADSVAVAHAVEDAGYGPATVQRVLFSARCGHRRVEYRWTSPIATGRACEYFGGDVDIVDPIYTR